MVLNKNLKTYLNLLWQSTVFWFVAFFMFLVIRFTGLKSTLELENPSYEFTLASKLEYALIMGTILGVVYSLLSFYSKIFCREE